MAYRRRLVRTFFCRVQNIYPHDQVREEFIKRMLLASGYPRHFIKHQRRQRKLYEKRVTVEKKQIFIVLLFKDDHFFNQTNRNSKSIIRHTYPAVQLRLLKITKSLRFQYYSSCLADPNVSHIVYQFTFSCGNVYIGKTDRCLT